MNDDLNVPANAEDNERLAKLMRTIKTALRHDDEKLARDALDLVYGVGRLRGRREGSQSAARSWGESIEKVFPQQSVGRVRSRRTEVKREEYQQWQRELLVPTKSQ